MMRSASLLRIAMKQLRSEVLRALSRVIEGTPKVETFEVGNSTSHQIAASAVG